MYSTVVIAALAALASAQRITFSSDPEPANLISDNIKTPNINGYKVESLGNKAINAPTDEDCYTYIGQHIFSDGQFDASRCVKACEDTTKYNAEHLNGRAVCRFVNTYVLALDGRYNAQVCAMYTRTWGLSFATNDGYSNDDGTYTIAASYTLSNIADPGNDKSCIKDDNTPPAITTTTTSALVSTTARPTSFTTSTRPGQTTTIATTTSTKSATPTETCFRIQARSQTDKHINGRWLEAPKLGLMKFDKDFKDGGLFTLDSQSQLRNAWTGSVTSRDPVGKLLYGPTWMTPQGIRKKDDKVTCYVESSVLKCYTRQGDRTYSKGSYFYIGQNGPKHMELVDLVVKEESCPSAVWKTWN